MMPIIVPIMIPANKKPPHVCPKCGHEFYDDPELGFFSFILIIIIFFIIIWFGVTIGWWLLQSSSVAMVHKTLYEILLSQLEVLKNLKLW